MNKTDVFRTESARLNLQFHITGRCNLKCKHCYRESTPDDELSLVNIKAVIEQFLILSKEYNKLHNIKKRCHINITGGEPFFRSDIKEILKYLGEKRDLVTYGVLSNGSFIDDEIILLLKETQASFVQLSIDGDKKIHDELREVGDYARVFSVAKQLEDNGIRTFISFTANKENYKCLPTVAKECRKKGITKLWSDRLVPIGKGVDLETVKITEKELPEYIAYLKKAQGSYITNKLCSKTKVLMNRALQFINSEGPVYSCSAGRSLIVVDEFGGVLPCRRLPIYCGDVFSSSLKEIYFNNEIFQKLRQSTIPAECKKCEYSLFCKGGAKCQSYAQYGSFDFADPACFLKNK